MARHEQTQESSPDFVMLGRRVRELRQQREFPQDRLALQANVDQSALSKLERGVRSMPRGALERIATALGVSYEELIRT